MSKNQILFLEFGSKIRRIIQYSGLDFYLVYNQFFNTFKKLIIFYHDQIIKNKDLELEKTLQLFVQLTPIDLYDLLYKLFKKTEIFSFYIININRIKLDSIHIELFKILQKTEDEPKDFLTDLDVKDFLNTQIEFPKIYFRNEVSDLDPILDCCNQNPECQFFFL